MTSALELSQTQSNALFYGGVAVSAATIITGIALFILAMNGNYFYGAIACWGVGVSAATFAVMLRCCLKQRPLPSDEENPVFLRQKLEQEAEAKTTLQQENGTLKQENGVLRLQLKQFESSEASLKQKLDSEVAKNEPLQKELVSALEKRLKELTPYAYAPYVGEGCSLNFTHALLFFYHFEMCKAKMANNAQRQEDLNALLPEDLRASLNWQTFIESTSFKDLIGLTKFEEPTVKVILPEAIEDLIPAFQAASILKDDKLLNIFSKKMAAHFDKMAAQIQTEKELHESKFALCDDTAILTFVIPKLNHPFALLCVEKNNLEANQQKLLEDRWMELTVATQPKPSYREEPVLERLIKVKGQLTWKEFYFATTLGTFSEKNAPLSAQTKISLSLFGSLVFSLTADISYEKKTDKEAMQVLDDLLQIYSTFCRNVQTITIRYLGNNTGALLAQFPSLKFFTYYPSGTAKLPLDLFKVLKIETLHVSNVSATLNDFVEAKKLCPSITSIETFYLKESAPPKEELVLDTFTISTSDRESHKKFVILNSLNSKSVIIHEFVFPISGDMPSKKETLEVDIQAVKKELKDSSITKVRLRYWDQSVEVILKD